MGAGARAAAASVYVDAFYPDVHEVTNAEYERLVPTHVRSEQSSCDDCPVTDVSWIAADAYCKALSPAKRLPTEAEWEKAAKGGLPTWAPEPFESYVWYDKETIKQAQRVATKKPNPYGLYDVTATIRYNHPPNFTLYFLGFRCAQDP
jgi:formylglycine-generating enzyme required for sulfatase activity